MTIAVQTPTPVRCPNQRCGNIQYTRVGKAVIIMDKTGNRHYVLHGIISSECRACGQAMVVDADVELTDALG